MSAKNGKALVAVEDLTDAERDERFSVLLSEMNQGKPRAASEMLALCQAFPDYWKRIGGLEYSAEHAWLRLMAPGDAPGAQFNREHITKELDGRRKALRRDGDSPLEQLLIDRLLSAWLQAMYTDMRYAHFLGQNEGTFKQGEYHQKNAERAARQLLRAVQALATVRRLIAPTQVNIGQNQINVVG